MFKLSLHVFIAAGALVFSACAPFRVGHICVGDTPARRIAKDMSIPGKGVDGQCLPFAMALHKKFQTAGIRSKVIGFKYEGLIGNRPDSRGAHAIVAYDDDGRTYVMDNQSWLPTWIHDASASGMAQQFSGMDFAIGDTRTLRP